MVVVGVVVVVVVHCVMIDWEEGGWLLCSTVATVISATSSS